MSQDLPQRIQQRARECYAKKNSAIDWNDWMWHDHVMVVAEHAKRIAMRENANVDDVVIAAYLHDIAFSRMRKDDPRCDDDSRTMALTILQEEGISRERALDIIEHIIEPHGMHGDIPTRREALVLATADAMAHLTTDFYRTLWEKKYLFEKKSSNEFRAWIIAKLDRDMQRKIRFEADRRIALPHYEKLHTYFSHVH